MSLISEALKKAQQERDDDLSKSGEGQSLPINNSNSGKNFRPLWKSPLLWSAGGALLIGVLALWLTTPAKVLVVNNPLPLYKAENLLPADDPKPTQPPPSDAKPIMESTIPVQTPIPIVPVQPMPVKVEPLDTPGLDIAPPSPAKVVKRQETVPAISAQDELDIKLRTAESGDDYVRLHQMLKKRGDGRAFDMVKRGLAAFPNHGILNQLAVVGYVRNHEYQEALGHADKALSLSFDNASLLTYRGLCNFHLKDYSRALADFGRSLAIDPQATENIYYLALIYDNQREYDLAIKYYRLFLERHPQSSSFRHKEYILDRLGQLTRSQGVS